MMRRTAISRQVYNVGLVLMLLTAVLSALLETDNVYTIPLCAAGAALLTLAARIWNQSTRQATQEDGGVIDLGGYPVDMLRE